MMGPYDVGAAFAAIEDELTASMMRNMARHRVEEIREERQWAMWQAMQLKALERYRRTNRKRYGRWFREMNGQIGALIRQARDTGGMEQEIAMLRGIQRGYHFPHMPERVLEALEAVEGASLSQKIPELIRSIRSGRSDPLTGEFFRLNERRLEALIEATTHDMEKAETAVLRMADDQYRRTIFNAQMYANTGSGTYEKAVDMATRDMLAAGLNCVEYKNGARHTLADYADMAIRTACKRAYLQGEGTKRQEWGISTVIMNRRGNPCPKCLPFCGKVMIDDVWSGGKSSDGPYPLMSTAIAAGLYHPRCKDSHTTYFPGISTADDTWTEEELKEVEKASKREARQQYAERQAERFGRLARYSLDEGNRERYRGKAAEWKKQVEKSPSLDIMSPEDTKEVIGVHTVGKIDREIYKCITDDIVMDEVIITDERIAHIRERHPDDLERYCGYISDIVASPDLIIEANREHTAVLLKEFVEKDEKFKLVLRIAVKNDPKGYKNSVISFWRVGETTWRKTLKNKKILYTRE